MMRLCLSTVLVAFLAVPAFAQSGGLPDNKPKVEVSLVAERSGVTPGGAVTIALKEAIRKDWHTYWVNPGDSGAPTTVTWHLPQGWQAGALQWPYPKRLPVGPLMNYGYDNQVALLSEFRAPADAKPGTSANISADVNWLVCSDVCIPESGHVSLTIPVEAAQSPTVAAAAPLFAQTRKNLPKPSPWPARYDAQAKRFALLVQNPGYLRQPPKSAEFYPYDDGIVESAAPQREAANSDGLVIESTPGYKLASPEKSKSIGKLGGLLVLTSATGQVTALDISAGRGTVAPATPIDTGAGGLALLMALLFAFAGGVILNLMPCVFPVLSMKALALTAKRDHVAAARRSALAYGSGVVSSFVALAAVLLLLRSAGMAVGWGFQLQQPVSVAALALLMFVIGLNLSGAFEVRLGANFGAKLTEKSGWAGSFFTGVLAVLVATPCTAPFMGAAAGFALTADAATALLVFAALGLGFAAPFVALSFVPALLRRLPRPGAWMSTFRQLLAFPMYGAAIWLTWVVSLQAGSDAVLALLSAGLLLAFALSVIGRGGTFGRTAWLRAGAAGIALAAAAAVLAGGLGGNGQSAQAGATAGDGAISYEPFSPARLAALQEEGRPVFVNATAAWCITCLVNERLALSGRAVARSFAGHKVVALKADWTNQDAAITELLARNGRSGVPLYLYFAPHAPSPVVLPQLLTESTLVSAVEKGS